MKTYQLDLLYHGKNYTYTGYAESLAQVYCKLLDIKLYVENNSLLADISTMINLAGYLNEPKIAYISPFKNGDNIYILFFDNYLNADLGQESWRIKEIAA